MAVGGAAKLLQLVDKTNSADLSSGPCQAYITEIISTASGKIYSLVQVAADVNDPNVITPFVVQCAVTAGVYWTWHKSTGGIAVPEEIKTAYREAIDEVKEYAEGLRAVGATPTPSTSAGLVNIDPNPSGNRITRKSLGRAGFT